MALNGGHTQELVSKFDRFHQRCMRCILGISIELYNVRSTSLLLSWLEDLV